jgi:hypothetical protein
MRQLCVSLILFITAAVAQAQEVFLPCLPGAKVFYINGVRAPAEQAASSAHNLAVSSTHFGVSCVADVAPLHNPTEGVYYDLVREIALQKSSEIGIAFADAVLDVGLLLSGQAPLLFNREVQNEVRAQLTARLEASSLESYSFVRDGRTITTADLVAEFDSRVTTELGQGTKVILVSHSQGNFFANSVHASIVARAPPAASMGLGVVNVANPSRVAPSGLSLTSSSDLVIAPLAALLLADVPNFVLAPSMDDLTGHTFDGTYLRRDKPLGLGESRSIGARLLSLLQSALDQTPNPVGTIIGSTYDRLFAIDLAGNTASFLGSFTFSNASQNQIWDIAISPRDGELVAMSSRDVYTSDGLTGSLTRLPQSTVGGNALAFSPDGDLYGMSGTRIYRFDQETGAATELPVSIAPYRSSGDLTFDSDGNLYGTGIGADGTDYLLRIDVARSSFTVVGRIGFSSVFGLYFSRGYLYGVTTSGSIIAINRATGEGSLVRALPFGRISGLQ